MLPVLRSSIVCRAHSTRLARLPGYLFLSSYFPKLSSKACSHSDDPFFLANSNLSHYYGSVVLTVWLATCHATLCIRNGMIASGTCASASAHVAVNLVYGWMLL